MFHFSIIHQLVPTPTEAFLFRQIFRCYRLSGPCNSLDYLVHDKKLVTEGMILIKENEIGLAEHCAAFTRTCFSS